MVRWAPGAYAPSPRHFLAARALFPLPDRHRPFRRNDRPGIAARHEGAPERRVAVDLHHRAGPRVKHLGLPLVRPALGLLLPPSPAKNEAAVVAERGLEGAHVVPLERRQ